ncbi:MAG: class I SAM-dependent methyltransferase [Candidatus Binatia bacterium]
MPNPSIFNSVSTAWSTENAAGKRLLDLSCGGGDTAEMLAKLGYQVVATDYGPPPPMNGVARLAGVDLNFFLPFQSASFDAVDLVEVIEHIENQPQLIREIARVLKPDGVVLISTPNVLNVMSRVRFLFTGFLRGRVRPAHYTSKPGVAPNIYLLHFYELYYLLFHYGFEIIELRKTRVKFAARFFACLFWLFMWFFSLITVIRAEKDPRQRRYNWQILSYFFNPALLLSDNIVVKAKKLSAGEDRLGA